MMDTIVLESKCERSVGVLKMSLENRVRKETMSGPQMDHSSFNLLKQSLLCSLSLPQTGMIRKRRQKMVAL